MRHAQMTYAPHKVAGTKHVACQATNEALPTTFNAGTYVGYLIKKSLFHLPAASQL